MIEFRNRVVKVIFYIIFGFLVFLSGFMVIMSYVQPSSTITPLVLITMLLFILLLPSLLMIWVFTRPTPTKRRPGKSSRGGVWLPIAAFVALSGIAAILMTLQSGSRCEVVGPDSNLWDCDFAGQDLSGLDLHGSDMTRIDLSGANLEGTNLNSVNLSHASLSNSVLVGVDLTDAVLFNARLDGADLTGAVLDGANLKWASLVGVAGLTQESLLGLGSWERMRLQDEDEMLTLLRQACDGMAIDNAATYDPAQGAMSILLVDDEGGMHPLWEYVPGFWLPASVADAELVACFGEPIMVDRGTCSYDDGSSMKRYSQRIELSIYVAQAGELLETITFEGPPPGGCPERVVAGSEQRDMIGEEPYGAQIIEALTPFASADGDLYPPRLP